MASELRSAVLRPINTVNKPNRLTVFRITHVECIQSKTLSLLVLGRSDDRAYGIS